MEARKHPTCTHISNKIFEESSAASGVPGAWFGAARCSPLPDGGACTTTSPPLLLVCSLEAIPERGGGFFLCVDVLQTIAAQLSSAWQGFSPVEKEGRHVGSKMSHKEDYEFYSGEIKEEKTVRDGSSGIYRA